MALWAIKALREKPLHPFTATSALRPMTTGRKVVEDYGHVGLTLSAPPVSFLRENLRRKRKETCGEAIQTRGRRRVQTAGLVLDRQKPGSAKGVMFITIEDETAIANLVIWPKLFEQRCRIILSGGMLAADGRVQRKAEVAHLIANSLTDLSASLAPIGDPDTVFTATHARATVRRQCLWDKPSGSKNGGFLAHRNHRGAEMSQKSGTRKLSSERIVKDIRRATRKQYPAEEKIRIVLDGRRGEHSIAKLCRREGIAESPYYIWSQEFLEAGRRRLAGDTPRAAASGEVKDLRREARALKEVVAEQALELRLLKKA